MGLTPADIVGFEAATAWLSERLNVERTPTRRLNVQEVFTLDRMVRLGEALGNPHRSYRVVHVAGSKGKGSVCDMVASALGGCGLAVGLYTSPHLVSLRERIMVAGQEIGERDFAECVAEVASAEASLDPAFRPITYFEALTAAAFVQFARAAVDVAVVEVGLGGRDDATNILTPAVCLITAVQSEHAALLGGSLASIAEHKAGILKRGVPAFTAPQTEEVMAILRARATLVGCPLHVADQDFDLCERVSRSAQGRLARRVSMRCPGACFDSVNVPLPGAHQTRNLALVLAAVDALGIKADVAALNAGLCRTPRRGRLELVCDSPRIVIDGAHTPESLEATLEALPGEFDYDSLTVVFGCAEDKDASAMISRLARGADKIIVTKASNHPRAVSPGALKKLNATGPCTLGAATVREALSTASRGAGARDLILVTGSFAVAGEAKAALRN